MRKFAKKSNIFGKAVIGVIAFEVVASGAAYYFWNRMNKSREFRYQLNDRAPWALKTYYSIGKTFNSDDSTEITDRQFWSDLEKNK